MDLWCCGRDIFRRLRAVVLLTVACAAAVGWTFLGWSDGNTANPRTITVPAGGATYTANFSQQTNHWSSGATDLGGSWKRLPWFGDYADLGGNWIWHLQLGYEYVYPSSTPTSIFFWDNSGLGWFWTSSTTYPYLYRFSDGAWLWYQTGTSSPRWFYDLTTGQWESR